MKEREYKFKELVDEWRNWSINADQSDEGWPSDFPQWLELMEITSVVMSSSEKLTNKILQEIEYCWVLSEETEDLLDYAQDHLQNCWEVIKYLVRSESRDVRWQVYAVLGHGGEEALTRLSDGGEEALTMLRDGMNDQDSYCRRRAILSLAKLKPKDAQDLAESLLRDRDPYIRQASIELVRISDNKEFIAKAKNVLMQDLLDHVRTVAKTL